MHLWIDIISIIQVNALLIMPAASSMINKVPGPPYVQREDLSDLQV